MLIAVRTDNHCGRMTEICATCDEIVPTEEIFFSCELCDREICYRCDRTCDNCGRFMCRNCMDEGEICEECASSSEAE